MKKFISALTSCLLIISFFNSSISRLLYNYISISVHASQVGDVSTYSPSADAIALIKGSEGCSNYCFWDNAQWSIGYGNSCPFTHTQNGTYWHQPGNHYISDNDALTLFNNSISEYVYRVNRDCKGIAMTQNQFDALLSAAYNHGNVMDCPLKYYLQGKLTESEAKEKYYVWCINPGTKDEVGLRARRKREADLFFKDSPVPVECGFSISGATLPADGYKHTPGKNFGLYGTVYSNHTITELWGGVYNLDGTPATDTSTSYDKPNTRTYNLGGKFNNDVIFDYIPEGNYFFSISAKDSCGTVNEIIHNNITVGNPAPTIINYTVSLDANGGSVECSSVTVSSSGVYPELPVPVRDRYSFIAWISSDGTYVDSGSHLAENSNHTLKALWEKSVFTISFNPDGGTTGTLSKDITIGNCYGTLPVPEKLGFIFEGWFTENGEHVLSDSGLYIEDDHVLYAKWRKVSAFEIEQTKIVLKSNEQYMIKSDAKDLTFSSEDKNIAIVSKNGVVTALNSGETIITISNTDGYKVLIKVVVEASKEQIKGDLNNNGVTNIIDLIIMQKWMLGMSNSEIENIEAADLNEDGKINIADFCIMKSILIS